MSDEKRADDWDSSCNLTCRTLKQLCAELAATRGEAMTARNDRRALTRAMRQQALAWPEELALLPESEWGQRAAALSLRPLAVWRSRHFLVTRYPAPSFRGIEVRHLSVNRVVLGMDGRWQQDIQWEELQRCKRETGHADWYGIEIYPRDRDIVNDANMRHLWLLSEPLGIGWIR